MRTQRSFFDTLTPEELHTITDDRDTPHEYSFWEQMNPEIWEKTCNAQQILTMRRVADWLHGNAKLYKANGDEEAAFLVIDLAVELIRLSDVREELVGE